MKNKIFRWINTTGEHQRFFSIGKGINDNSVTQLNNKLGGKVKAISLGKGENSFGIAWGQFTTDDFIRYKGWMAPYMPKSTNIVPHTPKGASFIPYGQYGQSILPSHFEKSMPLMLTEGMGNFKFKEGFDTHLINVEGVVRKKNKGIVGGHNFDNF